MANIFGRGLAACTVLGVDPDTVVGVRSISIEKHHTIKDVGIAVEFNDKSIGVSIGDFTKIYKKSTIGGTIDEMYFDDGLKKAYIAQIFNINLGTVDAFITVSLRKEKNND